jgi:hypothetical protein
MLHSSDPPLKIEDLQATIHMTGWAPAVSKFSSQG